nr:MAG TPA: hypothetical protein [Bacteriophage sp.]
MEKKKQLPLYSHKSRRHHSREEYMFPHCSLHNFSHL